MRYPGQMQVHPDRGPNLNSLIRNETELRYLTELVTLNPPYTIVFLNQSQIMLVNKIAAYPDLGEAFKLPAGVKRT